MRRLLVAVYLLSIAIVPVPALAQEATPSLPALPEATAPLGLGTVTLPTSEAEIIELLASLPGDLGGAAKGGEPAQRDGRVVVTYGESDPSLGPTILLQAVDFTRSDFFPADYTAGAYVATASQNADYGGVAFGREGDLVWIRAESSVGVGDAGEGTPIVTVPLYTLAWGNADSNWLFSAASFSPETLEALVTTFVKAAGGTPATPEATPRS
jgi:hypothetical protein